MCSKKYFHQQMTLLNVVVAISKNVSQINISWLMQVQHVGTEKAPLNRQEDLSCLNVRFNNLFKILPFNKLPLGPP